VSFRYSLSPWCVCLDEVRRAIYHSWKSPHTKATDGGSPMMRGTCEDRSRAAPQPRRGSKRSAGSSDGDRRAIGRVTAEQTRRGEDGRPLRGRTLVQAGPGIPAWNYGAHPFGWSGPVDPDQTVRFIVLGPLAWPCGASRVWHCCMVLHRLARTSFGMRLRLPGFPRPGGAVGAMLLACVAAALTACEPSHADPALLNELRDRLIAAPHCAPTCAEIMQAQIHVNGIGCRST